MWRKPKIRLSRKEHDCLVRMFGSLESIQGQPDGTYWEVGDIRYYRESLIQMYADMVVVIK